MTRIVGRTAVFGVAYTGAIATGTGGGARPWRIPATLIAAASAAVAALALATFPTPIAPSTHALVSRNVLQSHATRLPIDLVPTASATVGASAHSFWPVRRGGSLLADGGGIHSAFGASGVRLRVAHGTLAMSLASVGRGQRIEPVKAVAPSARSSEIHYSHGSIGEFYRNGPYGLEQGFTLRHRPLGGKGSLVLALGLGGSLTPEEAGSQILFRAHTGATALRYGQLSAVDAAGRQLPAHMQMRHGVLQLRIDDINARYPVRIDPFLQQGSKLTGGEEIGKGQLGESVALSADGNTALIGGFADNGEVGAAWVFTRSGSTWTQQGPKITGGGEVGKGRFGYSVALSTDGNTALIGGPRDNTSVGAAWAFTRSGSTWEQQGPKLTGGGETGKGQVGFRVALSADGDTALIGGPADNGFVGAAWAFTRSGSTWEQQGPKLTGAGEIGTGEFGAGVALSADGNTAVISGGGDNGAVGAAWAFTRSGSTWAQQGEKLTGGGEVGSGHFGFRVALSEDGNTALIGGGADSGEAGAAWVFTRSGSTWEQQGPKLTGGGEVGAGHFGYSVALSADGNLALIGGLADASEVGAAWVFARSGSTWEQQGGKLTGGGEIGQGLFGYGVALSADGTTALIGGGGDNSGLGAAWVFVNAPPLAPTVVTEPASSVKQTSAKLNATVNPNGGNVSDCHFEYGTSPSYGASVPCTALPGSGTSPVAVSASLAGLSANTSYHFQIVATNPGGTSSGADQTFTTATPPEFGRCVKVAKGVKGSYSNAVCTSPATPEKFGFEWQPGPGPKAKFSTKIKELTVATLETVKKATVVCKGEASTGEYTGTKTVGNVVVTFTACEMAGVKCTSAGAGEGEVVTTTLEGELGIEKTSIEGPLKDKVAMDLFPVGKTGPFMQFNCGPTAVSVRGSVLNPVKSNSMLLSATLKYAVSSGKQKPENFEGLPKDVLETEFDEAAAEQSGLKLTTQQTNEEKIEINSVV
jgi:hypothetical protein